jgi:hypothetical protein
MAKSENQSLQRLDPAEIHRTGVDEVTNQLTAYLTSLQLPSQGVLVPADERRAVIQNLPTVVKRLSDDARGGAMYISKFIAGCAVGLF